MSGTLFNDPTILKKMLVDAQQLGTCDFQRLLTQIWRQRERQTRSVCNVPISCWRCFLNCPKRRETDTNTGESIHNRHY